MSVKTRGQQHRKATNSITGSKTKVFCSTAKHRNMNNMLFQRHKQNSDIFAQTMCRKSHKKLQKDGDNGGVTGRREVMESELDLIPKIR